MTDKGNDKSAASRRENYRGVALNLALVIAPPACLFLLGVWKYRNPFDARAVFETPWVVLAVLGAVCAVAATVRLSKSLSAGVLWAVLTCIGWTYLCSLVQSVVSYSRIPPLYLQQSAELQTLYDALSAYAADYEGGLPPHDTDWRRLLLEGGYATEASFDSTFAEFGTYDGPAYRYLPATELVDDDRILLYLDPRLVGTVIAIEHSGRWQHLRRDDFTKLAVSFTLPDGTPYVPHLDEQ
ncbi:MAG: hypothetical protein AAF995_02560 [Planctomycetota bacterium]